MSDAIPAHQLGVVASNPGLPEEQLGRLADLIASGQATFPEDLTPGDCQRLEMLIRDQLRRRLLVVLARAIAQDITRKSAEKRDRP